jgi:hypothetical protein
MVFLEDGNGLVGQVCMKARQDDSAGRASDPRSKRGCRVSSTASISWSWPSVSF